MREYDRLLLLVSVVSFLVVFAGFRFFSCLRLRGIRRGILGIRIARFLVACVFLLCRVFQPFSRSSLALKLQFHIWDILPFNFLHNMLLVHGFNI